jgi:hypothetical protein
MIERKLPPRAAPACLSLLLAACAQAPIETPPATGQAAGQVQAPSRPPSGGAAPGATANAPAPAPVPVPSPERPSLGLFSQIKAPSELEPSFELKAAGVQIFRCEPDKEGYHWIFRLPEAELRDAHGQVVAHHGAGYSFEHTDGSRLLGSIVGYDTARTDNAVPWLLLQTKSYGQGEFAKVTYVQRVNTEGGMPPKQCSAEQSNQILRVPFSADFIFYHPH